jgi:hypothetical protein
MDSTVIIAIAGILGTLLAGLGGTALNHFLGERRSRAEVKRVYRQTRLALLVQFINSTMTMILKIQRSQNPPESVDSITELREAVINRSWTEMAVLEGFDKRLDSGIVKFLDLWNMFLLAKLEEIHGGDAESAQKVVRELAQETRELVRLCDQIAMER